MIVGQNALLNQYVPTFYIKNLQDGQGLLYDAVRKAYVNADISGGTGGANKLGELLNVSPTVDSPNPTLHNGQALVYNSFTSLWENTFLDYNTLLNKPVIPTNSSFSFANLSDTAKPSLPDGYVKWNSTGTQLVYSTTIPAASITGLATVATSGNYNDLINKPTTLGTVTSVSVVSANGISGAVTNPTSTPAITLTLGAITPASVAASGTMTGSNLSGVNTGDQTITLAGDITGSGTGTFTTTLATVNSTVGTFGTTTSVPQFTVDAKGRITNVVNVPISTSGVGTVTSVSALGTQGVTTVVTNGTTTPSISIGLGNINPISVSATGVVSGSNLSGTNTGDQTITLTGDITGSGTSSFPATLATVNASPQTNTFRKVTVNGKGLVTATSAVVPADITSALGYTPYNATNPAGYTSNTGTVTNIAAVGSNGITVVGSPVTSTGTLSFSLGAITPTSVAATGTVSGTNLSGTNTGDQTITLTGDVLGSGTGTFATNLALSGVTAGTYSKITVTSKGIVTSGAQLNSTDVTTALGFTPYNATNPAGYTNNTGTVTSVAGSGGTTGLTFTGSPITTSGTLTLGGTLNVANGGTGATTLTGYIKGNGTGAFTASATIPGSAISGDITGNSANVTGIVAITNGGTGATTASGAINALVPSQTGNAGKVLTTNGTTVQWTTDPFGTVTSVGAVGSADITVGGSPITTSGTFTFALSNTAVVPATYGSSTTVPVFTVDAKGRITGVTNTPIASSGAGTVTSVELSGGTTGLTTSGGPITGAGTITLAGTLAITAGGTGATTATTAINGLMPAQTGNAGKILTTNGSVISWITNTAGTVSSVAATGNNGITVIGSPITTSGTITLGLGAITPTSVAATGSVTGSNLSGTNTGDQTITLTGDATGSGTSTVLMTLNTVNATPGTYADAHFVPTITVNNKGLVTSVTTQHVDTSVRDLVPDTETIVIDQRHQYIVTGTMEVLGRIENNGRIAIL